MTRIHHDADQRTLRLDAAEQRHVVPFSRCTWREGDTVVTVTVGEHCVDTGWPWWQPWQPWTHPHTLRTATRRTLPNASAAPDQNT